MGDEALVSGFKDRLETFKNILGKVVGPNRQMVDFIGEELKVIQELSQEAARILEASIGTLQDVAKAVQKDKKASQKISKSIDELNVILNELFKYTRTISGTNESQNNISRRIDNIKRTLNDHRGKLQAIQSPAEGLGTRALRSFLPGWVMGQREVRVDPAVRDPSLRSSGVRDTRDRDPRDRDPRDRDPRDRDSRDRDPRDRDSNKRSGFDPSQRYDPTNPRGQQLFRDQSSSGNQTVGQTVQRSASGNQGLSKREKKERAKLELAKKAASSAPATGQVVTWKDQQGKPKTPDEQQQLFTLAPSSFAQQASSWKFGDKSTVKPDATNQTGFNTLGQGLNPATAQNPFASAANQGNQPFTFANARADAQAAQAERDKFNAAVRQAAQGPRQGGRRRRSKLTRRKTKSKKSRRRTRTKSQ